MNNQHRANLHPPNHSIESSLPNSQGITHGVFLSDLHLFSPRSNFGDRLQQLVRFQNEDQCIILGGDIFDFRWSDKGGLEPTVRAAEQWLEALLCQTGKSRLVFLPGNHDCHPDFLQSLERLAQQEPRFQWQQHLFQLQDCLFLHGDILDAGETETQLHAYRSKFHHSREQHPVLHRSYDVAVGLRIHKIVPIILRRPVPTCERLFRTLQSVPVPSMAEVRRVFFGHTHNPIKGLRYQGVAFFNPGTAMKHMSFQMHEFSMDGND